MKHPSGDGVAVLFYIDCREGSCDHQGLSGSGLRRGDLHHVACWIYSPPSGDAVGVVGRIYRPGYSL